MGTRFLATAENDWHPKFIQRILDAQIEDSVVLPGMYGPARFLQSQGTERLRRIVERHEMPEHELSLWKENAVKAAQRDGDVENGLVPAGQVPDSSTIDHPLRTCCSESLRRPRSG